MKHTIIYSRVSTESQVMHGISLDNQETRCNSYALSHLMSNVIVLSDKGISGKTVNRPAFQTMVEMMKNNEVENVIVYSLSRFARSVKDTLTMLDLFNKYKVNFHSITESIDTSTAVGRFFITTLSALAQLEREQISERTKSVLAHKKSKGQRTGGVPFGFKLDTDKKTLIENEDEQKTIKFIIDEKKSGTSYNKIVTKLMAAKHKNKSGNVKWFKHQVVRICRERIKK